MNGIELDYGHYYTRWNPDTPEHYVRMTAKYRELLGPYWPKDRAAQILEIGCGMGFALNACKEAGFVHACGIDADVSQVAASQRKGLAVTRVDDSTAYLSDFTDHYDMVLAFDLIEHLPLDKQITLCAAIHGALKPGGILMATVPNANSSLAARFRYNDLTHHTSFTEVSLEFLLYTCGFRTMTIGAAEERPRVPKPKRLFGSWFMRSWYWRAMRYWLLYSLVRGFRRLECVVELGAEGRSIPLSLNLLCVAKKD